MSAQPVSARYVADQYRGRTLSLIVAGQYYPTITFLSLLGLPAVIAFLLVDIRLYPRSRTLHVRFGVWILFTVYTGLCLVHCRAASPEVAYGIGIVSGSMIVRTATLLLFADPQQDYRRIKRGEGEAVGNGIIKQDALIADETSPDAPACLQFRGSQIRNRPLKSKDSAPPQHIFYYWQSFPDPLSWERVDWVADLVLNFRGVGWNWRVPNMPALPPSVQQAFHGPLTAVFTRPAKYRRTDEQQSLQDRASLLRHALTSLLQTYLLIDILKLIQLYDPYFWGVLDAQPPLLQFLRDFPAVVRAIRLLLTLAALRMGIQWVFGMAPLILSGLIGPGRVIGVQGEPWMHPDAFGSFQAIFERGLPGWWSGWWHQTLRHIFDVPGRKAVSALGLKRRSTLAKLLQLTIAFTLSACIHAGGSFSSSGDSRPLLGPFRFFLLQIPAIAFQWAVASYLRRLGVTSAVPNWVRQATNFIYVHVWLYLTAPLFVDDLAVAGFWLFEPLPFSPLRGLGFGPPGAGGWWCWSGSKFMWHTGNHWWDSGIVL